MGFEFGICLEPVHYGGDKVVSDLIGETAFLMAIGPNGDRYHTGIFRELSEFDYDFDGYATVTAHPAADKRLQELIKIQEEFRSGIRKVDTDAWLELDPTMGSIAWQESMFLDQNFGADTW